MALKLLPEDLSDVPSHLADRYEAQAGRYWDLFYRRNTTKFFKDRHYLHKEFPDLAAGPATLLEVGCGVGNTVFPLQETNPSLRIYCCDFAASAVELVRQNPQYSAAGGAIQAFVADITSDMLAGPQAEGGCGVPEGGCDLATMIFVLSAIHPQRMAAAVYNVARCLRPGSGRLLFRDYAEGDLAQERLAGGDRPKRLGPNFYVRGDGTRCYYFSQPEVLALFAAAGFVCDSVTLHERTVVNHKRDISMDRRWLQAVFTLRQYQPPAVPLRELLAQPAPSYQQPHHHHQQHPLHQQQPPHHHHHHPGASAWPTPLAEAAAAGTVSAGTNGGGGAAAACNVDVDMEMDMEMDTDGDGGDDGPRAAAAAGPMGRAEADVPSSQPSASAWVSCEEARARHLAEHGRGSAAVERTAAVPSGLLYGGSWLTGAAGRLASHLAAGPGQPSGRALLPETLDSADDLRAELSPSQHHQHQHHQHHQHRQHQHPQNLIQHKRHLSPGGPTPELATQQQQQQQQRPIGSHQQAGRGATGDADGEDDVAMQVDGGEDDGGEDALGDGDAAATGRRRRRSVGPGVEGGGGGGAGGGGRSGGRSLEDQLEAEFFATIGRDSAEVVAEEVAAAGAALSRVRLVDVAEMAAARLAAAAGGTPGGAGARHVPPPQPQLQQPQSQPHPQRQAAAAAASPQQQQQQQREAEVPVAPSVSFRCLLSGPPSVSPGDPEVPAVTLALARILLASPRLLAGKCALQLAPARAPHLPSSACALLGAAGSAGPAAAAAAARDAAVLPAMAAVRGSARRVVVSDAGREGLSAAAADLRRNAHLLVIERLRLVTLDWAAMAEPCPRDDAAAGATATAAAAASTVAHGIAAAASAVTGAAGYTFVSGAVRQLRDVLQMQPAGFDLVYAADPLSDFTGTVTGPGSGRRRGTQPSQRRARCSRWRNVCLRVGLVVGPAAGPAGRRRRGSGCFCCACRGPGRLRTGWVSRRSRGCAVGSCWSRSSWRRSTARMSPQRRAWAVRR